MDFRFYLAAFKITSIPTRCEPVQKRGASDENNDARRYDEKRRDDKEDGRRVVRDRHQEDLWRRE